jgi:hypothetical protein
MYGLSSYEGASVLLSKFLSFVLLLSPYKTPAVADVAKQTLSNNFSSPQFPTHEWQEANNSTCLFPLEFPQHPLSNVTSSFALVVREFTRTDVTIDSVEPAESSGWHSFPIVRLNQPPTNIFGNYTHSLITRDTRCPPSC